MAWKKLGRLLKDLARPLAELGEPPGTGRDETGRDETGRGRTRDRAYAAWSDCGRVSVLVFATVVNKMKASSRLISLRADFDGSLM